MIAQGTRSLSKTPLFKKGLALAFLATTALGGTLAYADDDSFFRPGNLLLSKAVYNANPNIITPGVTQLPPGCTTGCVTAINDGTYPTVFNNAFGKKGDGSFGVTSKIMIDELRADRDGDLLRSLEVPNSSQPRVTATSDQMVTSFSSKSEMALNLSLDHRTVSLMGYLAPIGAIDVSNSNTPDVVDPTNPVSEKVFRLVASLDRFGHFTFTETNAYSGNNGRSAILNDQTIPSVYYTSGNAGNGSKTQPVGVIEGTGLQIMTASHLPESQQVDPGQPTIVGSFNISELGLGTDKIGKDTNFRGLRVFNNVIYTTKGSGGNGINTVYFIDTSGNAANGNPNACPAGSGLPVLGATLPTTPIAINNAASVQTQGVKPFNMCILNGFPTGLAANTTPPLPMFPFGVWFANDHTLYVADEGNGSATFNPTTNTFSDAAAQTTAGLQKWVLNGNTWSLAYTLQAGLNLGVPYTVQNYPTGINPVSGLPWSPATDGLRNITGRHNHDGTVTIWAITSTVSGSGDQGADPNKLVMITDKIDATTLPAKESFTTVRTAAFGEALRGVSFTPGTDFDGDRDDRHCLFDRDDCRGDDDHGHDRD